MRIVIGKDDVEKSFSLIFLATSPPHNSSITRVESGDEFSGHRGSV
jgi:hypothetical protein